MAAIPILTLFLALLAANLTTHSHLKTALRASIPPANATWLDGLDLQRQAPEFGRFLSRRSVYGRPLALHGIVYPHGFGTLPNSTLEVNLEGGAARFAAMVGVNDITSVGACSVSFEVWVDGKKLAATGFLHQGDQPKLLSVDLGGARTLQLKVKSKGDGDPKTDADWAGALVFLRDGAAHQLSATVLSSEPLPAILFPDSPSPAIHGPRVVGTTPHRPFLFLIPATGKSPLSFSSGSLPPGLRLDPKTGIISGSVEKPGTYRTRLLVKGPGGAAHRGLTIIAGQHQLALTPPMGWNSWSVSSVSITAQQVREAADCLVKSGLAAHGYQYINIDDSWEDRRDATGQITSNSKFPDMRGLAAYVHQKGLKLGIYSSPGPLTCQGYEGSLGHEQQDADTYSKWGIDYLKYDWCSYGKAATGKGLERLKKPFRLMRQALDREDRDIVYSLSQYGRGSVWEWGRQVGANCWRTNTDITDNWQSLESIAFSQNGHQKYAGPGHWNDLDLLVAGQVGACNPRPTRLTPNEQHLQITLWCLQSSPLLLGCDLSRLDPFTRALLTNDEVLEIDQDPLGKPAGRVARSGYLEVWARPLWDGCKAVGLFNRGSAQATITARWQDLGLKGSQPVRDLWLQRDGGKYSNCFMTTVPAHGAVLLKIGKQVTGDQ